MRLAAQLKAASEQLDMLILGFEEACAKVEESKWPDLDAKAAIASFFKARINSGDLPSELGPKDWNRFADNVYAMIRSSNRNRKPDELSNLVTETVGAEIARLGPARVPRSVSLSQFTFGALARSHIITPNDSYVPIVTPDLEQLYPEVGQFVKRFEFE